jgi:hypothetical protein
MMAALIPKFRETTMLLTPTLSRTSSAESADGTHQIYVTHCLYDQGLFQKAGFGPRAGSTRDALVLRFASEYPVYELPAGLADEPLDPVATPRRLALVRIPGGRCALIHSVYSPDDGQGRANNFFSHFLIRQEIRARDALARWASLDWRTHCEEEGTALLPLTELPRPGMVSDAAVTGFLQRSVAADDANLPTLLCPSRLAREPAQRRELLRLVLRGCQLALQARPGSARCRFYLHAEPGLSALLLYAASRLLPEGLAARLTFSTYEDAHRTLRLYRHAAVVNTFTPEPTQELDDDLFGARGYALDTFTERHSPELLEKDAPGLEQWIDLAGEGQWATIDNVHQLLGANSATLVPLREAVHAARMSQRLAAGEALPEDLLALRRSSLGGPILEQHGEQVWRVVRDAGAGNDRLRTEFGELLRDHASELEARVAAALRARPPGEWRPHWRLLWSVLQHEPGRLRETLRRLLPEPPFPSELRFGMLCELQHALLSPLDQRAVLPGLLRGCSIEELERFSQSELPRAWFAHALCYSVLWPQTCEFAVRTLHEGDDTLVRAFWEQFRHLIDEDQRQAILTPLFPEGEPQAARFLSRLLHTGCTLRAETLQWLLDSLKVWRKDWIEFWGRDDHLGCLLEMLRGLGDEATPLWERLWSQFDQDVLLPGASYQQMLLMNLVAVRDRPGPPLPAGVIAAVNDWVGLREHFEKAAAVPESKRQAIIDACNRRRLDPIAPLKSYFARFVAPQGARPEVVEDFVAFFHSFYRAGGEHHHYSARLLGWLRAVAACDEDESLAALQRHYLEHHIPAEYRWQLADETYRIGLLLPSVYENVPKPTSEADAEALDSDTRTALDDEVFQLTGAWRAEEDIDASPLATVWLRGGWLIAGFIVGLAGLLWSALHAGKPQRLAELSLLAIPLVLLVDAVALQSVALTARTLKTRLLRRQSLWRDASREMLYGLYLGVAGGVLLAALAIVWAGSARLGICALLTAAGGSALAAGSGLVTVALFRLLPARPWMAAGPAARAGAVILALFLYFLLARLCVG